MWRSSNRTQPKLFLCPILQKMESTELCKGHIVPESLGGKEWVVQRKDVDNFFGSFAEAGFNHGVKLRSMKIEDAVSYVLKYRLAKRADLSLIDSTGHKMPVRPSKDRGEVRLIAKPSLGDNIDPNSDLSVSMHLDVTYETLLSCLHTAHLGLFSRMKYRYAMSPQGRFIAQLLKEVYLEFSGPKAAEERTSEAKQKKLKEMCQMHESMVRPLESVVAFHKNLLEDPFRTFIVCWCDKRPFATLHLIRAGSEWNAVMNYMSIDARALAFITAEKPISFQSTVGRFVNNVIDVCPLREDSSTLVWSTAESNGSTPPIPVEHAVRDLSNKI